MCGFTYDGSTDASGFKIYVNGEQDDAGNNTSGSYTASEPGSGVVTIGGATAGNG